ncbi:MAG: hypothetical protein LC795_15640 [Acidobacteria bacterium]|nr:hypothetical protein [Acidobacteriota bacterium]MCA1620708.1 hypothetical protein [Acidobacteriota bacterium]
MPKKVRVSAFVDATLKTTALLTFLDPETQEPVTDEFTVVYYALSPKKAAELDAWVEDYDRRYSALEARRDAHEAEEAKRRLKAEAEGGTFVEQPFADPEEVELKHGLAQLVARMVQSIPDIVEGEGDEERPVEITADLLSTFAAQNLRSIRDAVRKHAATDPTKPASSPSS